MRDAQPTNSVRRDHVAGIQVLNTSNFPAARGLTNLSSGESTREAVA